MFGFWFLVFGLCGVFCILYFLYFLFRLLLLPLVFSLSCISYYICSIITCEVRFNDGTVSRNLATEHVFTSDNHVFTSDNKVYYSFTVYISRIDSSCEHVLFMC